MNKGKLKILNKGSLKLTKRDGRIINVESDINKVKWKEIKDMCGEEMRAMEKGYKLLEELNKKGNNAS